MSLNRSRRLRWGLLLALPVLAGCRHSLAPDSALAHGIRFTDVTEAAGIHFRHDHGGFGQKLMPETVGSGVAWLDYDGDGWQDLVFVNCKPLSSTGRRPSDTPGDSSRPSASLVLYRNRGDGRFEDRSAAAGLDRFSWYGQGVTAADYDGDGDSDLFVTCLGPNHLLRNDGGRFVDATASSGLSDGAAPWRWHTGAIWLDFDRDGRLDLFVARYVKWTPETDVFCGIPGELKRYCPPTQYVGETCALYRNLGGGRFEDVSHRTGVSTVEGKWFQPILWDYDRDGWPDVLVTSDGTPTALFRNERGRRLRDVAAELGIGISETGIAKAGMGVDIADWRNAGQDAVLIGNFSGERLSLFETDSSGLYSDRAVRAGMGEPSLYSLTFGVAFLDADLDGWQDAFIANGHIDDYIERFESRVTYAQQPLFFRNLAGSRFAEIAAAAGPAFARPLVARGCAVADYDRDGDPDLIVTQNNREARLFRNDTPQRGNWLRIRLRAGHAGAPPIGARVTVTTPAARQTGCRRAGGAFLSQNEPVLHFGLGDARSADVRVFWPSGGESLHRNLPANREAVLAEPARTEASPIRPTAARTK